MSEAQPDSGEAAVAAACDDGLLMLGHLGGDQAAFPRLMRSWASPIYGYLARTGVSQSERDDLFQDVFFKVHRAAGRFDATRPFKPWLFAIVANTVRNHFTRDANKRPPLLSVLTADETAAPARAHELLEARETAIFLEEELQHLSMPQREVVILCCIERLTMREAAEALDIPANTVKTHLRRARIQMAESLARRKHRASREVVS